MHFFNACDVFVHTGGSDRKLFLKQTNGFSTSPVVPGSEKDSYISILQAINVTSNTTVTAIVDNGVGQTNRDSICNCFVHSHALFLLSVPDARSEIWYAGEGFQPK